MDNYFNYFTEVEERYQKRRGSVLLMSTLDWALIETWKDAGIPIEAVLRGIDSTFDAYDRKPARAKTRKVNSLAFCSQEVMSAADEMKEAAAGATTEQRKSSSAGFSVDEVTAFLTRNAKLLRDAALNGISAQAAQDSARDLDEQVISLAAAAEPDWEALERRLTVLEERIFAALHASATADDLVQVRAEADRDMAPYRSKMTGPQVEQLHRQYVNKRLLERAKLPRLSLFYM